MGPTATPGGWTVRRVGEFLRFCMVGGAAAGFSLASIYVLTEVFKLHYVLAYVVTFAVSNLMSFLANGRFVFYAASNEGRHAIVRFYALNMAGGVVNLVLLWVLVDGFGLWYMFANALLGAINAPVNYFLHRRLTFRVVDPVELPSP